VGKLKNEKLTSDMDSSVRVNKTLQFTSLYKQTPNLQGISNATLYF